MEVSASQVVPALADRGIKALDDDPHLANGLNVVAGKIVYQAVLDAIGDKSGI